MTIIKEILLTAGDRIVDAPQVGALIDAPPVGVSVAAPEDVKFNVRVVGYGKQSIQSDFSDDYYKRLFDGLNLQEVLAAVSVKALLESTSLSEAFAAIPLKVFSESLAMSEVMARLVALEKLEIATGVEDFAKTPIKALSELLTATEMTFTTTFSKAVAESLAMIESGVIQHNNYVDLSYMDSLDYVNTKTYF